MGGRFNLGKGRMKVTICCGDCPETGRLAGRLLDLGCELTLHSSMGASPLAAMGVPARNQRSYRAAVAPLIGLQKVGGVSKRFKDAAMLAMLRVLDARFAEIRNPGDVFIGAAGVCVESLRSARSWGAKVVLEAGGDHVAWTQDVGAREKCRNPGPKPRWLVDRESAGYELADVLVVESWQARQKLLDSGHVAEKVFWRSSSETDDLAWLENAIREPVVASY